MLLLGDGPMRIPTRFPVRVPVPPPPPEPPRPVTPPPVVSSAPVVVPVAAPPPPRPPLTAALTKPQAEAATATQTRALEQATARIDEVRQQQRAAPGGLRHEYQDMLRTAQAEAATRRTDLASSMEDEYRLNAQQTEPAAQRNIYDEQTKSLESRRPANEAARVDYDKAVTQGRQQALAAEPDNLFEAQWQRNAQIWEAEEAQFKFEKALAGGRPALQDNARMVDPALERQRVAVEGEWADVRQAFANEYDVVAGQQQPPQTGGAAPGSPDPVAAHRASIAAETFDPRYRDRILESATPGPDSGPVEAAVQTRVDAEVRNVQMRLRSDGAPAAFDEMVAAKQRLVDDPVGVPGAPPGGDPVVLALAQQRLDERLRPVQEQIAAAAPADLRQRAAAPATTDAEKWARAQDVSARLAEYASELPADLVPTLVEQSRDAWAPAVTLLGENSKAADSSHPSPSVRGERRDQPTDEFNAVVNDFNTVGEALAAAPGGDAALGAIADEFAGAVDSGDIGAFDEAFGRDGVGKGRGAHLAVEVINRLAAGSETRDVADDLLRGLGDGNQQWTETARKTLADFAANREALNRYIETFPGGIRALQADDVRSTVDPTGLELRDAIRKYLDRNPEVRQRDAELLGKIDADGLHLLHLELALQGLSPEASTLKHAASVADPVREMLKPDGAGAADSPALWQIYASTPSVNAEFGRFTSLAADYRQSAVDAPTVDAQATVPWLAESQGFMSMPRNARFMTLELLHKDQGMPGLQSPAVTNSQLVRASGVGFFGVAAAGAFLDAAGLGNQGLGGWDRAVAGLKGANYTYIGARDAVKIAQVATEKGSLTALHSSLQTVYQATGTDAKAFQGSLAPLAKSLQLASRGIFVATDAYTLVDDSLAGRNGGVIAGDAISLAGSAVMVGDVGLIAFGSRAAVAAWGGPVAWAGTALWTAGAVVKYQFDRIERSNRFETADQRRFLAHFGTRDDAGVLRTPAAGEQVEISNATDHDPDVRTVPMGRQGPDDIVYTGLSADGVDELMNYSGSPDDPVSGTRALDALAASHDIDARRFYLQWFEGSGAPAPGLTHEQRQALVVAAQAVDPATVGRGMSDEALAAGWNREWPSVESGFTTLDPERVPIDDRAALVEYVHGQNVVGYGETGQVYGAVPQADASKLRLLLGLRPPNPGEQAPSPEVRAAAEHVLAGTAPYGREVVNDDGMRPRTVGDLDYWMKLHDYPPLPSEQAPVALGPRPEPLEPAAPTEPLEEANPVDHRYTVRPGDTLWDIAERSRTPTDVWQLMDHHNRHNPAGQPDFDPKRVDGELFGPDAFDAAQRDPDLIHPGEEIQVADADDIRSTREQQALVQRVDAIEQSAQARGLDVVHETRGGRGQWNGALNRPLEPETVYVLDNGHAYTTDESGRVTLAEGVLELNPTDRNTYQQSKAGKVGGPGYDGGHLIASPLGGAGERINLIPQLATVNRGEYRVLEKTWADAVRAGDDVRVEVDPVYTSDSAVPESIDVTYWIDGQRQTATFRNT